MVTMVILVKPASSMFPEIREPILLNRELENEWLRDNLNEKSLKELINLSYVYDDLDAYSISRDLFRNNRLGKLPRTK